MQKKEKVIVVDNEVYVFTYFPERKLIKEVSRSNKLFRLCPYFRALSLLVALFLGGAQCDGIFEIARERYRFRGHVQLLRRSVDNIGEEVGAAGVFQHHQDFEALQTDQALARTQDPDSYLQSLGQGARLARLFSRPGHRGVRKPRLLRGKTAGKTFREKIN